VTGGPVADRDRDVEAMAEALCWPDRPIRLNDILTVSRDPAGWGKLAIPSGAR